MSALRRSPIVLFGALLASSLSGVPLATPLGAQARPRDVESIDAIIEALYESISGPAGERRDWNRFRSLFIDGARLIPTRPRPDGAIGHQVITVDAYIQSSGAMLEERGFFEREIHRTAERYGPVVHAFSTYESRWAAEDPNPFDRGINSIQLLHDGSRWWVVGIFWHSEGAGTPIPTKYLPGNGL